MIIENAIVFAYVSNRTLVIPSSFRYDHMHGLESFEKFLDLSYERERERENERENERERERERKKERKRNREREICVKI